LKVCRNSVKPADKLKFLVNVTSAVIHEQKHPMVIARAAYALSKANGTLFVQLLADQIPIDELQVITFHPGILFGDGWKASGITKDMLPFDECETATIHPKYKADCSINSGLAWCIRGLGCLERSRIRERSRPMGILGC
jgi:hypothetical protein